MGDGESITDVCDWADMEQAIAEEEASEVEEEEEVSEIEAEDVPQLEEDGEVSEMEAEDVPQLEEKKDAASSFERAPHHFDPSFVTEEPPAQVGVSFEKVVDFGYVVNENNITAEDMHLLSAKLDEEEEDVTETKKRQKKNSMGRPTKPTILLTERQWYTNCSNPTFARMFTLLKAQPTLNEFHRVQQLNICCSRVHPDVLDRT